MSRGILPFRFHPRFAFGIQFQFQFQFDPHFVRRNFSRVNDNAVKNPQLFVQSVIDQCKLGFSTPEIPVSIFHQLNSLRPRPSIIVFNQLLTAMSRFNLTLLFPPLLLSLISFSSPVYALIRIQFLFSHIVTVVWVVLILHSRSLVSSLSWGIFLILSDKLYIGVELLDKIVKLGIQPTLVTYGVIFKGFCRSGDTTDMERKASFTPDVVIYTTLIDGLCKDRRLPEALNLFEEMKSKGILPTVVTYNTLIRGMYALGQCDDDIKGMLAEMLDNNIAPNMCTYSTLIDMLCKRGNVNEATAILGLMCKRGVQANVITYGALLDGYCMRGEIHTYFGIAENIVDVMAKDGIMPNIVIFNSLLNGYCKSKQFNKAVVMFENIRLKGTRITPDVFTYNIIIDALCKDNRLHLALQHFTKMKGRGLAPTVVTYSSLLDGLLKNARIDRALSLRKEMDSNGVAPNIYTYNIIINSFCEVGRLVDAAEMFSYIVAKGLRLKASTYNIMIKVLCRQELFVDATALLKEMAENGCPPSPRTYFTIIKEIFNANDVAKALDHLDLMKRQCFAAHANTATLFTGLLTDSSIGDTDKALLRKYFLEM